MTPVIDSIHCMKLKTMKSHRVYEILLLLLCSPLLVPVYKCADSEIGDCEEGRANCSSCYLTLVKSLLSKDGNLFNLSRAFFPANNFGRPQFITIYYHFKDLNETKTWYWSEDGAYFIYPMQTLQFLSLFFGRASAYFAGEVEVTLDKECLEASSTTMQHLTQRVSLEPYSITLHKSCTLKYLQ